jgi:hypothetical protein
VSPRRISRAAEVRAGSGFLELIATGLATLYGAGFAGVVSHVVREPDDVSRAVELFRMNYERAKVVARSGPTPPG